MRQVEILKPIGGYAKGDKPILPGSVVREYVASGHAKRLPKEKGKD
jgi:hypothetical protein